MMNAARSMWGCTWPEASPPTDRTDPPVGSPPLEALPVSPPQDRPLAALADGEVDGPCCTRNERDGRGLVALAEDTQGSVTPLEAQVLDVCGARLTDPQAVEPEQHSQRRMVAVVLLGGEQEHAELGAVETPGVRWVYPGPADVLGRVRPDPPVGVSKPIEAADRREPAVDRRRRQTRVLPSRSGTAQCGGESPPTQGSRCPLPTGRSPAGRVGRPRGSCRCSGPGTRQRRAERRQPGTRALDAGSSTAWNRASS